MMLIPCPWCGPRPETEFTFGEDATLTRPADPAAISDVEEEESVLVDCDIEVTENRFVGSLSSIPFVGTVIDVFYKANRRNIALLRGHMTEAHAKKKAAAAAARTHREGS